MPIQGWNDEIIEFPEFFTKNSHFQHDAPSWSPPNLEALRILPHIVCSHVHRQRLLGIFVLDIVHQVFNKSSQSGGAKYMYANTLKQ